MGTFIYYNCCKYGPTEIPLTLRLRSGGIDKVITIPYGNKATVTVAAGDKVKLWWSDGQGKCVQGSHSLKDKVSTFEAGLPPLTFQVVWGKTSRPIFI